MNLQDENVTYLAISSRDLEDLIKVMWESILFLKNLYPNIKDEEERRRILAKEYVLVNTIVNFGITGKLHPGNSIRQLLRFYFDIPDNVDYKQFTEIEELDEL